jgi:hypothetical protein
MTLPILPPVHSFSGAINSIAVPATLPTAGVHALAFLAITDTLKSESPGVANPP